MIISIDAEKPFEKFQYLFMIKSLKETKNRRIIPQHNEVYV
jgi:hypothetical protein